MVAPKNRNNNSSYTHCSEEMKKVSTSDQNHSQLIIETLNNDLNQKNFQIAKLWDALNREQEEKQSVTEALQKENTSFQQEKDHLVTLLQFRDYENRNLRYAVRNLIRWNEKLDQGIRALLQSKRWMIGNTLGELFRKIFFRPKKPMPADYLEETLSKYNKWLSERDL